MNKQRKKLATNEQTTKIIHTTHAWAKGKGCPMCIGQYTNKWARSNFFATLFS